MSPAIRLENLMPELPLPIDQITAIAAVCACLFALLAVILMLLQSGRASSLERLMREESDALRRAFTELDQGLRRELASVTRETLSSAFEQVRSGLTAQADGLERFGRMQREAVGQSLAHFGEQQGNRLDTVDRTVREANAAMHAAQAAFKQQVGETIERLIATSSSSLDSFSTRLLALDATLKSEQEQLRTLVGAQLEAMRAGNEAKLEEMRKAVDEKLQSALEKQLKDSFTNLQEQLASVQQAIGQVQSVAGEVGDLKRLFSNVKSRGGWGEAQLEAMLTDILPTGAFEKNFRVKDGSGEAVEFALRVPGRGGDHAYIAIDSKFPTEDYGRLVAAHELGNREEEAAARAALAARVRLEARKIGQKYIAVPRTLEFAMLYLPSDSLFAEIARIPGLIEQARHDSSVMVVGPSLLPAFLHTLRVSYVTLALEQKASEIGETLAAVKTQWSKFGDALAIIKNRADLLSRGIDDTIKRCGG
eukprot:gene9669-9733_t